MSTLRTYRLRNELIARRESLEIQPTSAAFTIATSTPGTAAIQTTSGAQQITWAEPGDAVGPTIARTP